MSKIKKNPALVACLIIAVFWVVFALHNQPQQTTAMIQKAASAQSAITKPIAKAVELKTAQASTAPISGKPIFVPVLMYHHVADLTSVQRHADPSGSDLTVSPKDFDTELGFLHDQGYHSITTAQLYEALVNGGQLPSKPMIVSLDDGYKDVFVNAIPILHKYGYSASFAIITDKVGSADYGTWDDVLAADKAGMEIVSHTEHHPDLSSSKYSHAQLHDEIFGSKATLEAKLGHSVDFFIYPYGHYNSYVEDLLTQAGYKMAFTTAFGLYQNPATLLAEPRVRVHGIETMDKFKFSLGLGSRTAASPTNP